LGLDRTLELLDRIGNPHGKLRFVHVAGTNGKGSFSCMLAGILQKSGYKTGLYTSPYIVTFNERMRINGQNIPDDELVDVISFIKPHAEAMEDKPTEFELITAAAFEYFYRNRCDVVVLEVGMGGGLDSTNVITSPELSVITAIGLDHIRELGSDYRRIASAKAGIIKDGCPVLFYGDNPEAEEVIKAVAAEKDSPLYSPDFGLIRDLGSSADGTRMAYKSYDEVCVPLAGAFQKKNTAMVLEAAELLKEKFSGITDESVKAGLASVRWPARFEIIHKSPYVILDGAHNPHGIRAAVESIEQYFNGEKIYLVTGVMADKDYRELADIVSPVTEKVFTVTPDNPRALSAEELTQVFREKGKSAAAFESIPDAVSSAYTEAKKNGIRVIAAFGSLYMYSEVKSAFDTVLSEEK
ncbi:MAG: bifunctional folylpolyglutamate synthase/dihydrofolate synthase, partial [Clostridia bacterium]|nr:bifunctional folylpolyglutamate synthase/dihydrofolate synthase [Clostridia bacterium]